MSATITCVLIDDDMDDQEIFLYVMREINPDIFCRFFNDGDEAVRALQKEKDFLPDYLFIDLNMPRMSGMTCLREIKKIERLKKVPAAIYTTSSDPGDKNNALQAGADAFIVKEASMDDLKPGLEAFLTNAPGKHHA
ncbi:response regulator [Chitinophaga sp. XS-30]|uniref:response regulator n=1 Tax=Chitinophaga sp. XS-30 TaxID=2604421 RepID=UPI0011DE130C|nr:response regulator [Chitinophaga sp. XS-30]QEH39548.1 response regulator [Chitinophaga sp. XS-30]